MERVGLSESPDERVVETAPIFIEAQFLDIKVPCVAHRFEAGGRGADYVAVGAIITPGEERFGVVEGATHAAEVIFHEPSLADSTMPDHMKIVRLVERIELTLSGNNL